MKFNNKKVAKIHRKLRKYLKKTEHETKTNYFLDILVDWRIFLIHVSTHIGTATWIIYAKSYLFWTRWICHGNSRSITWLMRKDHI